MKYIVFAICLYLASYGLLYRHRKPAANLAYWAYTEDTPDWVENGLYYGFFPIYYVHQRMFHVGRHVWDRPDVTIPADFQG